MDVSWELVAVLDLDDLIVVIDEVGADADHGPVGGGDGLIEAVGEHAGVQALGAEEGLLGEGDALDGEEFLGGVPLARRLGGRRVRAWLGWTRRSLIPQQESKALRERQREEESAEEAGIYPASPLTFRPKVAAWVAKCPDRRAWGGIRFDWCGPVEFDHAIYIDLYS